MIYRILTISHFVVLETYRSKFFLLIGAAILVSFTVALFAQSVSVTEGELTFVSLLAALLRITAITALTLLVVTASSKEFQSQGLDTVLASDITRAEFYLGKFFGYGMNALLVCLLLGGTLLLVANPLQVLLWGSSFFFEVLIVVSFALFCSTNFKQPTIAISLILGFYVLARSISAISLISQAPTIRDESLSQLVAPQIISAISTLLPDFSHFTQTQWLIYETGIYSDVGMHFVQAIIYTSLLVFAGLIDFYRKNY